MTNDGVDQQHVAADEIQQSSVACGLIGIAVAWALHQQHHKDDNETKQNLHKGQVHVEIALKQHELLLSISFAGHLDYGQQVRQSSGAQKPTGNAKGQTSPWNRQDADIKSQARSKCTLQLQWTSMKQ